MAVPEPRPASVIGCGSVTGVNEALWLSSRGRFEVRDASVPTPGRGELVVQVHSIAVNPIDALTGPLRRVVTPWVRFPTVIGSDISGEVMSVGTGVTRFRRGDRVLAYAAGQERARNTPAEGAFQHQAIVLDRVCTSIPDDMPFTQAAVLPLGLSTAAAGLFEADQLGLPYPATSIGPRDDFVLVWGASSSVGCNAVQLARASGFNVLATAGVRNHDLVRSLGAHAVFDYRDAGVDHKIVGALAGRRLAGTIAIGRGSLTHALRITRRSNGAKRIASVHPDPLTCTRSLMARVRGIDITTIWGGTPTHSPVGPAIFQDFLPDALREGRFRPMPLPTTTGTSLGDIPHALEALRAGVSASKLVVTLTVPGEE